MVDLCLGQIIRFDSRLIEMTEVLHCTYWQTQSPCTFIVLWTPFSAHVQSELQTRLLGFSENVDSPKGIVRITETFTCAQGFVTLCLFVISLVATYIIFTGFTQKLSTSIPR